MKSVWQNLARKFRSSEDIVIAEADCGSDPELCSGIYVMISINNFVSKS